MRRRIGTVIVAELAVIALINDSMMVSECEFADVALIPINTVEQGIERRTKIKAAPASIADFVDALRVL